MTGMRIRLLRSACTLAACGLAAGTLAACHWPIHMQLHEEEPAAAAAPAPPAPVVASHRVDFATQVRPILETRCQPCHFEGGKMYAQLPFDRAETVLELREKLFTRIKDEGEQRTIREFLAQHQAAAGTRPAGP